MIKQISKIISFIAVQFLLGKRGSFPYGILMHFSLLEITMMVIVSDIIQTCLLMSFMQWFKKVPLPGKIKAKLEHRKKTKLLKEKPHLWQKLKQRGCWGLFTIAALPYGGGALTGSIVATSMGIDRKRAIFLIIGGCILGTMLFYCFFSGVLMVSI
jgi:uncharacterized membrane protein